MEAFFGPDGAMVVLGLLVFAAGFVDAIAGGGGLISLPAYFAMGLPPHIALASNKFSACLGTATAVFRYWRAGQLRLGLGLWAALGALLGSALGTQLALLTPPAVIRGALLVLVPLVLAFFLLKDRLARRQVEAAPRSAAQTRRALLLGLLVGAYDGFFGPGTGTFLAIGFNAFLALDLVAASANARLANLASNAASMTVFLLAGKVLFPLALFMAGAGILGNLLGSKLAIARGARLVKPLMVLVLLLLLGEVLRQVLST